MQSTRWILPALAVLGALTWPAEMATAAPPWGRFPLFRRVEADPSKDYVLTEDHGPWLIMCVTFSGEEAESQAKELVLELRSRHALNAYTHNKTFDLTDGTIGRGIDQYGQPLRMKYRVDRIAEVAVLVGDFSSIDDPQARKLLERIKYMKPDALNLAKRAEAGKKESRTLAAFRLAQQVVQDIADTGSESKGPMGHAFVTTNPLLPEEYYRPTGIDQFVVKMNEDLKYSLLTCPGPYTLKIATFAGYSVIDVKSEEVERGNKQIKSRLVDAAEKAHKITESLRKRGFEAYEFHDRRSSIVCVGSFTRIGTPRADGQIDFDPAIQQLVQTFGAQRTSALSQYPGSLQPTPATYGPPKKEAGVDLDIQPMVVQVPKRNVSADYNQSRLSLR